MENLLLVHPTDRHVIDILIFERLKDHQLFVRYEIINNLDELYLISRQNLIFQVQFLLFNDQEDMAHSVATQVTRSELTKLFLGSYLKKQIHKQRYENIDTLVRQKINGRTILKQFELFQLTILNREVVYARSVFDNNCKFNLYLSVEV